MPTSKKTTKADAAAAAKPREPEQQVRRKRTPDPSAVNMANAYTPAARYARAPEMGGTNAALAGVEGGAGVGGDSSIPAAGDNASTAGSGGTAAGGV